MQIQGSALLNAGTVESVDSLGSKLYACAWFFSRRFRPSSNLTSRLANMRRRIVESNLPVSEKQEGLRFRRQQFVPRLSVVGGFAGKFGIGHDVLPRPRRKHRRPIRLDGSQSGRNDPATCNIPTLSVSGEAPLLLISRITRNQFENHAGPGNFVAMGVGITQGLLR